MGQDTGAVDLTDELSAYDAIALLWQIPRHRVKTLIIAGCYGLGGSHKTFEQWKEQLSTWDSEYDTSGAVLPEKLRKAVEPKRASIADLFKFKGKKK